MRSAHEDRDFRVEVTDGLPVVQVDGELIELAIRQLLNNAVKYSNRDSPISVCARRCKTSVVISVIDQGPGIPEEDQARIFERFFRGQRAHRGTVGTGMGLAIAREIVRAHGGDISFQSSPSQGTEFSISVPITAVERGP